VDLPASGGNPYPVVYVTVSKPIYTDAIILLSYFANPDLGYPFPDTGFQIASYGNGSGLSTFVIFGNQPTAATLGINWCVLTYGTPGHNAP
jgi:hypothetical protein